MLLVVGGNSPSIADGLARDGHINGPHTTIELTTSQASALDHGTRMVLTPIQKRLMLSATGVSGVKELEVFPRTTDACTCETANVAVRTGKKSIEVADSFFGLDLAAGEKEGPGWAKRHDERLAAQRSEWRMVSPPEEVQLRMRASKLQQSGQAKSAITLLQQAIEIRPDYKWARRDLASIYAGLSGGACGPAAEPPRKIYYCKQALMVLDADDVLLTHVIQQTLDRIDKRMATP
jgi:hypothetical protein